MLDDKRQKRRPPVGQHNKRKQNSNVFQKMFYKYFLQKIKRKL